MTNEKAAPPDWRELCEELADKLATCWPSTFDAPDCLQRARAALAQPEPEVEGPTDEELDRLEHPHWEETGVEEWGRREAIFNHRSYARAVLARWGRQPAPPAEGEVAELVAWLRANALTVQKASGNPANGAKQRMNRAADLLEQRHPAPAPPAEINCPGCEGVPKPGNQPCAVCGRSASSAGGEVAELAWWLRSLEDASVWFESGSPEALKLTRAADLLEQRHPAPVPVPVAERLPGPEDCDAEGRCWWLHVGEDGVGDWFQRRPYPSTTSYTFFRMTHWLPANALPLPSGEVE